MTRVLACTPLNRSTTYPVGGNSGVAARLAPWDRANVGRHTRRWREAGSAGIRKDEADGAIGISVPVPDRVRRAASG
jgi:hypothetical protein